VVRTMHLSYAEAVARTERLTHGTQRWQPALRGGLFSVRRRCAGAADKGCHATLSSAALECLRDLGKASLECSLVAADNNVHVNGNQCVVRDRQHVSQRRNDD
jgi:hypothetical protein